MGEERPDVIWLCFLAFSLPIRQPRCAITEYNQPRDFLISKVLNHEHVPAAIAAIRRGIPHAPPKFRYQANNAIKKDVVLRRFVISPGRADPKRNTAEKPRGRFHCNCLKLF